MCDLFLTPGIKGLNVVPRKNFGHNQLKVKFFSSTHKLFVKEPTKN